MKSNTTTIWLVLAVILAGAIWFVQKHLQPGPPADTTLLAGLRAADVTSVQVAPAGEREISVVRTNNDWYLERPVAYPAQATAIQALLQQLEKLSPTLRLTAAEMQTHKDADVEFGFENPQFTLDINAGAQSWHLRIGNKTAPGDGVYIRLVGGAGGYVTDVGWLQGLPRNSNAWRDTSLVGDVSAIDWLVITNGTKTIELRRDTNRLWRMTSPLQARADNVYITTALQQLHSAQATKFITDDPKADLAAYGLQPAELDVWLGRGTNVQDVLHLGKDPADRPGQLYARRGNWGSVVTASKDAFAPWRGEVNDFRDPHLVAFTASIAEIEVHGAGNFTVQRGASNQWLIAGEKFPVDMQALEFFARMLANLRVSEFVKDAVTETDLQGFGLTPTNSLSVTLRSNPGDSNAVIASILFGATETNRIYARRSDENFVYAVNLDDVKQLPKAGWELRDRQVWHFTPNEVAQIIVHQDGKTRQVIHNGPRMWTLAPGSQGTVDVVGLEESANMFGTMTADGWFDRNPADPAKYGFGTNSPSITFELKSGEKLTVDFGSVVPSASAPTAIAAVTMDDGRWIFGFPPVLYQLIGAYLAIPPGTP